jgi:hypothetical protein
MLPSHARDDAAEATWPWRDVDCRVMLVTMLPSHAHDGAARATWPRRDGATTQSYTGCGRVAQPLRSEHRGVVAL